MKRSVWLAAIIACCSVGCAKAPFTTSVLENYGLTPADLARVQFFTSEEIVLEREVSQQASERGGSELRLQDETHTEVVHVSERIPCVVLRVEGDYLLLGFSPRDLRAALWFKAEPLDDVAGAERRYVLTALENTYAEQEQPFAPRFSKGFLVSWSDHKYHIVSGRGAHLLYQIADDEREKVEVRAPGWRLSDRAPARPVLATPTSGGEPASEP